MFSDRWFDPAYDPQSHKSPPDHRRTDSDPAHHSRQYHESQQPTHPHMSHDNKVHITPPITDSYYDNGFSLLSK